MKGGEFIWRDGERVVFFGADAAARTAEELPRHGFERYELLASARALETAPAALREAAVGVHEVAAGAVNELAAELIGSLPGEPLVALGGGRVIDTAKAIAAVQGAAVAAIPTTLSGAELTAIHKLPDGHSAERLVRPVLVFADPLAMTTLPDRLLRASAMNALAHGADSLYTPFSNPVSELSALRGAELIASALDGFTGPAARADLALGSLLSAHALDSALFGLHHVICQTLVRVMRVPHAETNAAILPWALGALSPRAPAAFERLAAALGTNPEGLPGRVEELGGGTRRLGELGARTELLDTALDGMLARDQLANTPDPPDRAELRAIVESAW